MLLVQSGWNFKPVVLFNFIQMCIKLQYVCKCLAMYIPCCICYCSSSFKNCCQGGLQGQDPDWTYIFIYHKHACTCRSSISIIMQSMDQPTTANLLLNPCILGLEVYVMFCLQLLQNFIVGRQKVHMYTACIYIDSEYLILNLLMHQIRA